MTASPEMWNAINTIGLVVLGFLALYNNRKLNVVHKELNGAKGALLNKIETLSRFKADSTGLEEDAKTAVAAAITASEHREEIAKSKL